jgi:hypothetical protein
LKQEPRKGEEKLKMAEKIEQTEIVYDIGTGCVDSSGTLGYQASLYLIPSREHRDGKIEIYLWSHVWSGCPASACSNRWFCLGAVGVTVDRESLQSQLGAFEDDFREIDASYLGAEWNGSNYVGKWDRDSEDERWHQIASQACESADKVWEAGDWFGGSIRDVELNTGEALSEIAEREAVHADGAILHTDDVLQFLRDAIQSELEELLDADDEDDEDDAEKIALYQRLLAE